jgi:hypothetical protein
VMLLSLASSMIEAMTPRPVDSLPGREAPRPDAASVFLSFTDPEWPAMGALALAAATLHPDRLLASRIRIALDPAVEAGPPDWLANIDQIAITGTFRQHHVLGDGDNIVIGWRWPGGHEAAAVVYIDHNLGTLVKDAFVIDEAVDGLFVAYRELDDGHTGFDPIAPADARARIEEAIERGEHTVPPFETETWPQCRPLVEWLCRRLPLGGSGHSRPDWPEAQRRQLAEDFLASSHPVINRLSRSQVGDILDPLLWFGCDYGPGDPLRWSPVAVEILLTDWFPRKVFGLPVELMRHMPDVLEDFIRFADNRRQVPPELTEKTVAAIGEWRTIYLIAVGQPGRSPQSGAARLARMAAGLDPDAPEAFATVGDGDFDVELDDLGLEPVELPNLDDADFMTRAVDDLEASAVERAGGQAAYESLNDEPLADVAFDWAGIDEGQRHLTGLALQHLDGWAAELFDAEVATIARSVLAAVVAGDPAVFKRSARADALAAGILGYLIKRLSGRLSVTVRTEQLGWNVFTQKDLAQATGVSATTIGSRSHTVAKVLERAPIYWPSILHSSQRRDILLSRQLIAEWRAEHD